MASLLDKMKFDWVKKNWRLALAFTQARVLLQNITNIVDPSTGGNPIRGATNT
ncbi:hypothetical protein MTR_7g056293 [Medicago truncatula]|uniref:Uncharacterized protein n=1 Tax=Medicago truncatula TaxID=3880 RepID=A0A072TYR9_MEDTR|nr:hypothetical protein MTR_7g056293 [Medicago truncatula]